MNGMETKRKNIYSGVLHTLILFEAPTTNKVDWLEFRVVFTCTIVVIV